MSSSRTPIHVAAGAPAADAPSEAAELLRLSSVIPGVEFASAHSKLIPVVSSQGLRSFESV